MGGIKYLLKITLLAILVVASLVFFARQRGLSKSFAPFDHSLLKSPKPWFILSVPSNKILALENWKIPSTLLSSPHFKIQLNLGPARASADKAEWDRTFSVLDRILNFYPKHNFILNFQSDAPGVAAKILEYATQEALLPRILIASPSDGLLNDLRTKAPQAAFSCGQGTVTQILLLTSLFLEPVMKIKGDVVTMPGSLIGDSKVEARMRREIHRQQKLLLVSEPQSSVQAQSLLANGVDGIVSSNLDLLVTLLPLSQ